MPKHAWISPPPPKPTMATPATPQEKDIFGPSYTFRIRRHVGGHWGGQGLWELALLNDNGAVKKLISDADGLTFCLDNLMGELESDGF